MKLELRQDFQTLTSHQNGEEKKVTQLEERGMQKVYESNLDPEISLWEDWAAKWKNQHVSHWGPTRRGCFASYSPTHTPLPGPALPSRGMEPGPSLLFLFPVQSPHLLFWVPTPGSSYSPSSASQGKLEEGGRSSWRSWESYLQFNQQTGSMFREGWWGS